MKLRGRHEGRHGAQNDTTRRGRRGNASAVSPARLVGAFALLLLATDLERGVFGQEWATEYPRVIYHEQDRSVASVAGGRSAASGRLQVAVAPGWSARPVSAGAVAHGRNDLLQPPAPPALAPAPPAPPEDAACGPCAAGGFRCADCACVPLARRCDGAADCAGGEDEAQCAPPCDEADGRLQCPHTAACISKDWLCDGDNDCGDYSDESRCAGEAVNCTSDQFECDNGLCIHRSWVCDSDNDCKDNSDEKNCSAVGCAANQFQCGSGQCISLHWKCDKDSDCLDLTDETDCPVELATCGDGEFHCANRRCVREDFQCDGDNDCEDWSDEDECPLLPSSCDAGEFKCRDDKCIPLRWRCDRETDCTEGDDEDNCGVTDMRTCSGDEYTCSDSKCILRTWVCDGVADCFNGEDELKCEVSCEEDQYMCKPYSNRTIISSAFSTCVNKKHVCDGLKDCPRGDDEDKCPTKRDCEASSPCEKLCITTVDGHEGCACPAGYVLGDDTYSCRDIDECMYEQDPVCSQTCSNTIGSFTCGCMTGYVLRPDLRTCKAIGASPTLLFSNRLEIREVSLSSDRYTSVLKGLHNAVALDYHYEKQLIFWTEITLDVIRMAFVNGTNATDIIKWGLQAPGGVAVDWIHDLLFWTDSGTRRVEVATLDGKKRAVVAASDLDKPRAIAVHPGDALVFWTDWGPSPKIERSDMDGGNRKSVIISDIFWPNGLTIDYTSGKIYWADAKHHIIECANFDGRLRKKVTSKGLPHPYALTLFEDAIYWTDWHTKSISTVNKNTGVGFQTIHAGLNVPMDIHSYHPQRQPPYKNHCNENNGGCSYLCLPNYSSHSCHCPKGHNLKADGRTCEISPEKLLVFARKKDIRIQQLIPSKKDLDIDMVIPLNGIKSAVALAWDHETNSIFWTDVDRDSINGAYLNGSNQHVIVSTNLMSPAGVAFDWITKKLYWSDAGTNRIEVANVDGSMRALLAWENIDKPRDIVVDPINGVMYWSDWGESPCIESAWMDGDNRHRIISNNITWPNGLALDLERSRIYWSDGGTRSIEHSKLDGTDRQILINTDLPHPFGLDLYGNEVIWTDWDTSSIQAANKLTGTNRRELGSGITGLMDVRVFHKERHGGLNRCGLNNGGCSHLCLLNPGGYSCFCPIGIKLGMDGKTCSNGPVNFLIIAHRIDIRIVSLDMPYLVDVVVPLPPLKNALGVDVDRNTGDIYWTDTLEGIIKSGTRDGKNIKTLIDSGIRNVEGIILDSVGRKIYWTDGGRNSIEVAELNGRNRKILIWTNLDSPRGIVLHYRRGYMYWTDWGKNPRIERAGMDGSKRKIIIKDNLIWPNSLAIDQAADRLYWNDAKRSIIESSDLDGEDRRTTSTDPAYPYGLVIVDSYVYWTDWKSKALHRADKLNGSNSITIRDKLEGLMDIRAIQIEQNPQNLADNICSKDNGGCSHLCLRAPGGYSCACPTGIAFNLPEDAADRPTICKSHPSTFLIFATGTSLGMISLEAPELWDVTLPLTDVNNSIAVDFHWEHKLIFYTDVSLNVIRRVNMLNMTQTKTVISGNVYTPNGLGVDWIANNIYWTDNEHKVLEVARLDGSSRKILINDMDEPRSLVLYPRKGYVYWTDWGENPRIERAFLDGSDRKSIIDSDLGFPNGLAIDFREKRLYWTDVLKDRIDTSDLHGNKRVQLIPDAKHPFGLTQLADSLYWTDWHNKSIIRSNKSSGVCVKIMKTDLKLVMEIKAVSPEKQKGWNPCKENNGGCSHLCLFLGTNYTCACPDSPDSRPCIEVPEKWVTLTRPDQEDDYTDTDDENENGDSDKKQTKSGVRPSTSSTDVTMYLTYTMAIFVKIMVVVAFLYFLYICLRRRSKHMIGDNYEDGPEGGRVISFPNPNYNANGGGSVQIEPERRRNTRFLIFRYDRSQDRVTNVYPPEGASLIPPIQSMGSHTPPSAHKDGQLAHSLRHHDDFDTVTLHPMG